CTACLRSRSGWAECHKRASTPAGAWSAGADCLVIGRPLTEASDPAAAARRLLKSLE
ncbi:MAG: orotidine 5'-phosphate decarboxylase, partial [Alphaproteobacteria bacterium]|nr:orotidine 5'-phosphate decarboxylase [Alphaproteobacteria bacterium]